MNNEIIYVAKSVLVNSDGKILCLRRSTTDSHDPGRYDLPGGKVETGEHLSEGAAREISEEVGLPVAVNDLRLVYASTKRSQRTETETETNWVIRLLYVGKTNVTAVVLSEEHDLAEWCEKDEFLRRFSESSWTEGIAIAVA